MAIKTVKSFCRSCAGHRGMELLNEGVADFHGLEVRRGGNFCAHFEPHAHIFPVFSGMGWKPPGSLMKVSRFGPGDLIARVYGFKQQWNRHLFQIAI